MSKPYKFPASRFVCDSCGHEPNMIGNSGQKAGEPCGRFYRNWISRHWAKVKCDGTIRKKGKGRK